mgnify:FL=1|tara:strand:+ start:829 stop:1098 length:270 start_codon:yes stop_codon:yes gene_type:complete
MAKEKMVDLKPKVDKISDEHLNTIKNLISTVNALQLNIGRLEGQKHNLLHELFSVNNKVLEVQEMFTKEYGTNDINIADGTINREDNEK